MPPFHCIGLSPSEVEDLELDALLQDVLIGDSHTLIITLLQISFNWALTLAFLGNTSYTAFQMY